MDIKDDLPKWSGHKNNSELEMSSSSWTNQKVGTGTVNSKNNEYFYPPKKEYFHGLISVFYDYIKISANASG